ncbi:MAG: type IV pilus twitching motility protein PilT [bacterium]
MDIVHLVQLMKDRGASDIHIGIEKPPMLRIDGVLTPVEKEEKISAERAQQVIYSILNDDQKMKFEENNELDLSFGVKDTARIRMNVFRQKGTVCAALRSIPDEVPNFERLRLPSIVNDIVNLPPKSPGLVLVTGPTGTGKTTTLASMIDYINTNRKEHIITVEDPIEFFHRSKESIVHQREIVADTKSFTNALKYVLRQDPDIVLVGEMRDLETIRVTLNIAETGHLVFSTLHTSDAVQSINRIIDVFPKNEQRQVRTQLSFVLKAVISQQLLPHISGTGRILACEVLSATEAVRSLIRDEDPKKLPQIYTCMQTGKEHKMQTMNMSIQELYDNKLITYEDALKYSPRPEELKQLIGGQYYYERRNLY